MAIKILPMTGNLVRSHMSEKKISQRDLAEALDLSQAAIYRRLAGDVDFTISEIYVVAERLSVDVSELMSSSEFSQNSEEIAFIDIPMPAPSPVDSPQGPGEGVSSSSPPG